MPEISNVSPVGWFRLHARFVWKSLGQGGRRVSAYCRQTDARRLLSNCLSVVFLVCSSLMLMGINSCDQTIDTYLVTMRQLSQIFSLLIFRVREQRGQRIPRQPGIRA